MSFRNDTNRTMRPTIGKWVCALVVLGVLGFAATASAVVTKTYTLQPQSKLVTPISSSIDFFEGHGLTPTWTNDGGSGHSAAVTTNKMTIEFSELSPGVIDPNGTVTVTELNYYHQIDAGLAGVVIITGQQDTSVNAAVGTLNGNFQVTSWSNDFTLGELHNEIYCENVGANTLCGAAGGVGLPEDMTTDVTHLDDNLEPDLTPGTPLSVDTANVPVMGALPMTFTDGYDQVCFEMTIDQTLGRQYYDICSGPFTGVPSGNTTTYAVIAGLLALAGASVIALRRKNLGLAA